MSCFEKTKTKIVKLIYLTALHYYFSVCHCVDAIEVMLNKSYQNFNVKCIHLKIILFCASPWKKPSFKHFIKLAFRTHVDCHRYNTASITIQKKFKCETNYGNVYNVYIQKMKLNLYIYIKKQLFSYLLLLNLRNMKSFKRKIYSVIVSSCFPCNQYFLMFALYFTNNFSLKQILNSLHNSTSQFPLQLLFREPSR